MRGLWCISMVDPHTDNQQETKTKWTANIEYLYTDIKAGMVKNDETGEEEPAPTIRNFR